MKTIGNVNGTSTRQIIVRGLNDPTYDDSQLDAAVSQLNSWGEGTLVIDGPVYLTTAKTFTAPISIRGLNQDAEIITKNATDYFASFTWDQGFNPLSATSWSITTSKPRATYFTTPGGFNPTKGDWIIVYSEDTIPNVEPHGGTYSPRPLELHQISHVDSTNTRTYVADFIVDQLTTSAKVAYVPMMSGVQIRNIKISHEGTQGLYQTAFRLETCSEVIMDNITYPRGGGGAIWVGICGNVITQSVIHNGTEAFENVYGFVAGACNGWIISDCIINGTRHGFTTTSSATGSGPLRRYGTPLNVQLNNCIGYNYTKINESTGAATGRLMFDTHAEGWGIQFNNCTVICAGANGIPDYGFQSRSRATQFNNCRVIGSYELNDGNNNGAIAFRMWGAELCKMKDCYVEGVWQGLVIADSYLDNYAVNCQVDNCYFNHTRGEAIRMIRGSGLTLTNTVFKGCAGTSGDEVIEFGGGSGHVVDGCYFEKNNQLYSMEINSLNDDAIDITNCTFKGWTTGNLLGINGTNAANLTSRSVAFNTTPIGVGTRKEGQDGYGFVSGSHTVDFDDGNFDNKTFVMNGNVTLSLSGTRPGQYQLLVSQDPTGGRTISFPGNIRWETSAQQPEAGSNAPTLYRFYFDGTTFHSEYITGL